MIGTRVGGLRGTRNNVEKVVRGNGASMTLPEPDAKSRVRKELLRKEGNFLFL